MAETDTNTDNIEIKHLVPRKKVKKVKGGYFRKNRF